jgi:hypothetical protein
MDVSPNELRKETAATLRSIEATIGSVKAEAERVGVEPESLRYHDGTWPMIPLLLAKSQCLNTLTLLRGESQKTRVGHRSDKR